MKSTNHYFRPLGLLLLLCLLPLWAFAQTIAVQGTVKDSAGDPVVGASVLEVGTTNGTITDIDGNFKMNVSSKGTLRVSFIGYKTQEIPVAGKKQINVDLKDDTELLDEVVVVGYGQMKRSDLTGSVVSVSSDVIGKTVTTSIDQVLQGRAAGVQVQQNSGIPGGSSSIRIRGTNSINASNEPIYVIDGVVIDGESKSGTDNPLASINPADIVSMDILKDASATAIYGSRGANGVIMITTKKGVKGDATINYNGYIGWQMMPKKLDMMNLREYAEHKNERSDMGIVMRDDYFVRPDLLGEGTDWQDEMFSVAMMNNHDLSISGGSEKSTYSLGAGYLDQEGIAIGSGFNRLTLRGSFDSQVKKFLKVGLNVALSKSEQKLTVSDESLIAVALRQTPNVAVRNADGTYDGPDTSEYVQNNPVGLAMIKENYNKKFGLRANVYAEATLLKGLTFKTELGLNYGFTSTYKFDPSYKFGALENTTRESNRSKSDNEFWNWSNLLTYNRTFGVHNINFMLGQEMQKSAWEYLAGYRSGFLTNNATDLNLGDATTAKNWNNTGASSLMSFFGRAFYSFDDRYLLTTTLRRDGSSKFHKDHRWGWFPSAALAWKVSNEAFLKDNEVINNLKFRLGYGEVGNQNVPNYAYTATYGAVATAKWGTSLIATNTPNPELQWEKTSSTNLGLDLNLFQNRIEFIADLYYKKTNNLLLQLPLPNYVGTSPTGQGSTPPPWYNIGSIENKGIELTLNTVNIDTKGFQWRSNFVFSLNRNKVASLVTETSNYPGKIRTGSDETPVTQTAVGYGVGQFYGYKVIGRFEKATDFYYKDKEGNVKPVALPKDMSISEVGVWIGDYIFEDIDKNGVIDEADRTYIGNPEPKFTYGIGNSFSYKGFDLSVFLTGSYGNDVVNYMSRYIGNPRENTNLLKSVRDYAHLALIDPNGPNDYRNIYIESGDPYACRIGASPAASTSNFRFSDKFVEDGSYLRIQSISLGYTLPRTWVSKAGIQNLKLYCNLQNVYTFTKYSGYDPEVGSINQDALLTGIDNYRYPSPRIYTFGVNVTF